MGMVHSNAKPSPSLRLRLPPITHGSFLGGKAEESGLSFIIQYPDASLPGCVAIMIKMCFIFFDDML
jgi:hypothetical protein